MAMNKSAAADKKHKDSGNAVIATFFAIIIAICYYILIYRLFGRADTLVATYSVLRIARWVFIAFAAALAVLAWKACKDGKEIIMRRCIWGAVIALLLAISFFMITYAYVEGAKLACIAFVLLAVLRLFYLIYEWEFTLSAIQFAAAEVALYLTIYYNSVWSIVAVVLAVLVILAVLALELFVKRTGGKLILRKRKFRILRKNAKYFLAFLAAALSVAAIVVGLISPALGYYAMIGLACVAFVYIVYYTVKLM